MLGIQSQSREWGYPRELSHVEIYRFRFLTYEEPYARFQVACTKGTYVRSLAHDLGQKIGCGAHLATLRRIVSGRLDVADASLFEDVLAMSRDELAGKVIPFLKIAV